MKQIVIAGENSYIGTALAAYLKKKPDEYAVRTESTINRMPASFSFRDADTVINVAAIVHKKEKPEMLSLYETVNRDLAVALAEKAKADGASQFIQFSTMNVYGMISGVITAGTIPNPVSMYGWSKLEAERAIAKLADEQFRVAVLRPPMVYGEGAKGNYRTLERLTKLTPVCPTLKNARSLVSVENLCAFIRHRIDDPRSGVFFPQDPEPVSTSELMERIAEKQGRKLWRTSLINPAVRLLRLTTTAGKKAFGDLIYENLSELPLKAVYDGVSNE